MRDKWQTPPLGREKGGRKDLSRCLNTPEARSFKPRPASRTALAAGHIQQVSQAHEYGLTAARLGSLCHRRRQAWSTGLPGRFFREAAGERSCRRKRFTPPELRDRDSPPPDDSPVECGVGMPKGANTCYASSAADQEITSIQIACGRAVGLDFLRCKTLHDKCLARRAYTGCISRGTEKLQSIAMSISHKLSGSIYLDGGLSVFLSRPVSDFNDLSYLTGAVFQRGDPA